MDFIEELGTLALGSRIKNLSELLMKDVSKIYKDQDYDFEPRWFTFFQLILKKGEIPVTEIARELNQTHPAAIQVIHKLEKRKLISTRGDQSDKRKRLVRLTKKGRMLAEELQPLWNVIHQSAEEILAESDPELIGHIKKVEDAIKQKSTYRRIEEKLISQILQDIQFIPYSEKYIQDFRQLKEDWLNAYLTITAYDSKILSDPSGEIIKRNGKIFLMISKDKVIGTYALQMTGENECELTKFTVQKKYRGHKLGERMLEHAI